MKRYYFYSKYKHNGHPPRRDNKTYYANGHGSYNGDGNRSSLNCSGYYEIRVPSMKRSKSTWKRFYRLFPHLRHEEVFRGSKLKKI